MEAPLGELPEGSHREPTGESRCKIPQAKLYTRADPRGISQADTLGSEQTSYLRWVSARAYFHHYNY